MDIRIFFYIVIILLGFLLGNGNDASGNKRKWYIIMIISLLILESCLRSLSVGPDTRTYYYVFYNMKFVSWHEILSSFGETYIEGEGRDPGYMVYMKLIQIISTNFNVFLFFSALFFFIPLGIILYRYSTHMLQLVFAFILYIALFNIVALSGIRQQIATGFAFMALLQLDKNKYLKSIVLIGIGAFIHISAVIFLAIVIIRFFFRNSSKKLHLLSFAVIPLGIVFAGPIMLYLASFLANDYYSVYGAKESSGGGVVYVFLMETLSLFCYISIKKERLENDNNVSLLYPMLPLLTATVPLITLDGSMIRIGQYFTLYMMLLVPYAIDAFAKSLSNRKSLYFVMIAFLLVLSFSDGFNYHFFWQEVPGF